MNLEGVEIPQCFIHPSSAVTTPSDKPHVPAATTAAAAAAVVAVVAAVWLENGYMCSNVYTGDRFLIPQWNENMTHTLSNPPTVPHQPARCLENDLKKWITCRDHKDQDIRTLPKSIRTLFGMYTSLKILGLK